MQITVQHYYIVVCVGACVLVRVVKANGSCQRHARGLMHHLLSLPEATRWSHIISVILPLTDSLAVLQKGRLNNTKY